MGDKKCMGIIACDGQNALRACKRSGAARLEKQTGGATKAELFRQTLTDCTGSLNARGASLGKTARDSCSITSGKEAG
jgi:hypothetical protein